MSCGKWEGKITIPAGNWTATLREYVPAAVTWIEDANVAITGNDLVKDAGGTDWNAGAHTAASITHDGYVEWKAGQADKSVGCGLSATNPGATLAEIDFAILAHTIGVATVYENGVDKTPTDQRAYTAATVFRIQVIGTVVTFWFDGSLWYTSATAATLPLLVDCSLYEEGAAINDAVVASTGAGSTVTLTATKTYYHSSAGNDTLDLPARLMALLDAAGAATYTVTVDASEEGTGQYTISATGGSVADFTIAWVSTGLRNLLGWTGNLATGGGTLSYTSQGAAEGLWLPDGAPLSLTSLGDEIDETDMTVLESPTGAQTHYLVYHRREVQTDLRYPQISRRKARIVGETYANESWQQFWRDVLNGAATYLTIGYVRIYPDAGDDATHEDYWVGAGLAECRPVALRDGWQGVFAIVIPRLVVVE